MPKPVANVTQMLTRAERRIQRYLDLQSQRKKIDAELDDLKTEINTDLEAADDHTIETESFKATLVASCNSRIDPDKLLELGVKPSIIRRATKETPYSYPKVTAKKPHA